jgi:hypothetical protein
MQSASSPTRPTGTRCKCRPVLISLGCTSDFESFANKLDAFRQSPKLLNSFKQNCNEILLCLGWRKCTTKESPWKVYFLPREAVQPRSQSHFCGSFIMSMFRVVLPLSRVFDGSRIILFKVTQRSRAFHLLTWRREPPACKPGSSLVSYRNSSAETWSQTRNSWRGIRLTTTLSS